MNAGLTCHRLTFQWPGRPPDQPPVLQSVEASFPAGTVSLITGDTGSGKSTLLHLLAGLLRPTAGEIRADNQPVSRWTARHRDAWRQGVGIIFQHLAVVPDLTVAENLLMPLIPRRMTWSRMQERIADILERVDLPGLATIPAGHLSGGQRQRLALARALVVCPRFLLADEPTAFQDDAQAQHMADLFEDCAHQGAVVIICSHDRRLDRAAPGDRHYHLDHGRLILRRPPKAQP